MAATKSIYVIDDDTGLRTAYTAALSRLGYQVEGAADGLEALDLMKAKGKPTMILLDMLMPNLDGLGFLKQLRSEPANKAVKVIIVSNFAAMPEASQLGVTKYISKTEKEPEEVAAIVDGLLKAT